MLHIYTVMQLNPLQPATAECQYTDQLLYMQNISTFICFSIYMTIKELTARIVPNAFFHCVLFSCKKLIQLTLNLIELMLHLFRRQLHC